MSHSPGPWHWGWYDDQSLVDEYELCQHNGSQIGVRGEDVEKGNAALIASAPELLAMLRELEWAGNAEVYPQCPVCLQRPERTRTVPGEPVSGMPGYVRWTGQTEAVPGGHSPDCRLAKLLGRFA